MVSVVAGIDGAFDVDRGVAGGERLDARGLGRGGEGGRCGEREEDQDESGEKARGQGGSI